MNIFDTRSEERLCISITRLKETRSGRRQRPAPINTTGVRIAIPTGLIGNSDDRTPDTADPAYSPRVSAQATPQAIVTAIRWQSLSASSALQPSELAFPFSPTSPSHQRHAFPSPRSPMETSWLPSGRVLKSPFSYVGSPYPFSPPLSASRLCPNTYRNIPRIDTNVQNELRISTAQRVTLTPALIQRARRENPQSGESPIDVSPTTPVTVEAGYPMILDPVTPTVYTPELAILNRSNTLLSSRAPPGPVRTRARKDSLNRGRDPYRQDLRGQGGVSQRTTLEPRPRSGDEVFFAMGYGSGHVEGASRNGDMPNKRSRRMPQVNLDWYGTAGPTQQQSYAAYVTLPHGTEDAVRQQMSRG